MSTDKRAVYARILEELTALLQGERDLVANAANTAALLNEHLDQINWVGFYFCRGDRIGRRSVSGTAGLRANPVGPGCLRYRGRPA